MPISGAQMSGSSFLCPLPLWHLSSSNKGFFLPFFFLVCIQPEVSSAERSCAEDPALAVGGATCGSASPSTGRRESRCTTPPSSSRQIRARVLCQVGRTVLLALFLGQGASGTRALLFPLFWDLDYCHSYSGLPYPLFSFIFGLCSHILAASLVSICGSLGFQSSLFSLALFP